MPWPRLMRWEEHNWITLPPTVQEVVKLCLEGGYKPRMVDLILHSDVYERYLAEHKAVQLPLKVSKMVADLWKIASVKQFN